MPTDDDNAEMPTVEANAPDVSALTPELLESHPYVQELKAKQAAAHSKMDQSNLSRKQLEQEVKRLKELAGEEIEQPSYVTKEELEAKAWELSHAKDVELYQDEDYQKELEMGIPKEVALRYAKLRHQSNPNQAQVMRQQSVAQGSAASTRDLSSIEITDEDRADMKRFGYSEKALLKQKKLKAERI